jgi:hypothetical protein
LGRLTAFSDVDERHGNVAAQRGEAASGRANVIGLVTGEDAFIRHPANDAGQATEQGPISAVRRS